MRSGDARTVPSALAPAPSGPRNAFVAGERAFSIGSVGGGVPPPRVCFFPPQEGFEYPLVVPSSPGSPGASISIPPISALSSEEVSAASASIMGAVTSIVLSSVGSSRDSA